MLIMNIVIVIQIKLNQYDERDKITLSTKFHPVFLRRPGDVISFDHLGVFNISIIFSMS